MSAELPSDYREERFTITFSAYEVANLREALGAIGCGSPWHNSPLQALHTGDWTCQIWLKLPEVDYAPICSAELMAERARAWLGLRAMAERAMAEDPARQADTPSSEAPPDYREELERLRAIEKAAREVTARFPAGGFLTFSPEWVALRSALDAGDGQ